MRNDMLYAARLRYAALIIFLPAFFSLQAQYVTTGSASSGSQGCFQLTPDQPFQGGAVWYQNKLNLSSDFQITATLNFGNKNATGADGIAFVLQPVCTGLGGTGQGLGYQGIVPSLAVEFDTWQNPNLSDIITDHVAVQINGDPVHGGPNTLWPPIPLFNIEDGQDHLVFIRWFKSVNNLQVIMDGVPLINYVGNIVDQVFNGDPLVFWGFSAGTGASFNRQSVCINGTVQQEETPYTISHPSCANVSDGGIDLQITGNAGPYTYIWNTGATTEDLNNLSAGTYSVVVRDKNGCENRYVFTLQASADQAPVLSCPANLTVETDRNDCSAAVNYSAPNAVDNCPGIQIIQTGGLVAGAAFPTGTTLNAFTAIDAGGASATCQFSITVIDKKPPVLNCPPDITLQCGSPLTPNITGLAGVSDACGVLPPSYSDTPSASDCPGNLFFTRSWSASDVNGNTAACLQKIKLQDIVPPMIICPANVTVNCNTDPTSPAGNPTVMDQCDPAPVVKYTDVINGDCDLNCVITRTWTATDNCGNSVKCNQTITRGALTLVEQVLNADTNGDGIPDGIVMGKENSTLTIGPGLGACILNWYPASGTTPSGLVYAKQTVKADCLPGTNPVDASGKLRNPLLAEALKLTVIVRLKPALGKQKLAGISNCTVPLIIRQYLAPDPDINELLRATNLALGNIAMQSQLNELTALLKCINGPLEICE